MARYSRAETVGAAKGGKIEVFDAVAEMDLGKAQAPYAGSMPVSAE